MIWILIFSALFVEIKSLTLVQTRNQITPKTSEILTIMRATSNVHGVDHEINESIKQYDKQLEFSSAETIQKYFKKFKEVEGVLKSSFDTVIYNYVVKNLRDYSAIVRSLIKQTPQEDSQNDVDSFKFEENFDYCVVTYFFNSDHTNDSTFDVNQMLRVIYFLQILAHIKYNDASDTRSDINENVSAFLEELKLLDGSVPEDHGENDDSKLSKEELIRKLEKINSDISNISKTFCLAKAPPIIDKNLVLKPNGRETSSKFITSILNNETFDLIHEEIRSINNKNIYSIKLWRCAKTKRSLAIQFDDYKRSVTIQTTDSSTESFDPKVQTNSHNESLDTEKGILYTNETLNSFLDSLKIRHEYINAVQYHNIAMDVLIFVSMEIGYTMFGGIKTLVKDSCTDDAGSEKIKTPLTGDLILIIKSQLLLFRFYYGEMLNKIFLRVHTIVYGEQKEYITFNRLLLNVLRIFKSVPFENTSVKELCQTDIQIKLQDVSDAHYGDDYDEIKYKEYYFLTSTRDMFDIYNFYMLNLHNL